MVNVYIRKLFSTIIIFLLVIPNFIIPVSATTEAQKVFELSFGVQVNDVETNIDGTRTYAGLENGSIICMDNAGNVIYNYLNAGTGDKAIKKIVVDDTGNLIFLTKGSLAGYLNSAGTILDWYASGATVSASDIAISRDGTLWWKLENSSSATGVYAFASGGHYGSSYSSSGLPGSNFAQMEYDSEGGLVVFRNSSYSGELSNKIYLYNISDYTGWLNLNPTKVARNSTVLLMDNFPYRKNISFGNTAPYNVSLIFLDNASATDVSLFPNGTGNFNSALHGTYFLWAPGYQANISQSFVNYSYYNATLKQYQVSLFNQTGNITMYYGSLTYNNTIVTSRYNIYENIFVTTNESGWTVPNNTDQVTRINVTGGGGGGDIDTSGSNPGQGGRTSTSVSGTYGAVTPGTYFSFTIGAGGAGGYWSGGKVDPTSGGTTTAFGISSSGGGIKRGVGVATGESHAQANAEMKGGTGFNGSGVNDQGTGGMGYGAGGGGSQTWTGSYYPGGKGATGAVNFTYRHYTTSYYAGSNTSLPYLVPLSHETRDTSKSMNYVANLGLAGCVTDISIPEGGLMVGITTRGIGAGSTGTVYHQEITTTGFGSQYAGSSSAGVSDDIATSDGASYSIESRASYLDIYSLNGTQEGTYAGGGSMTSVDIADKNGLWACGGGEDGKLYIFTKAETSSWIVYYQGDSETAITSVAMSERGEYVALGRSDGSFEYYNVQADASTTTASSFSVDVFVTKGGTAYTNINMTIAEVSSTGVLVSGTINTTGKTDTGGKFVFPVTERKIYTITVNDGEKTQTYQASTNYRVVAISLAYPLMTRPYEYSATYTESTHTITSIYNDVDLANVNISIYDTAAKTMVYSADYAGTKSVTNNYVVPDANKSYNVRFSFVRVTGASYQDTVYVQSPLFNAIPKNTSDQYTLFIYGVYTLMLMIIALSIGPLSLKYGTVFLVAITFLGIILGLLPLSLYTAGIATSAFIALLEVYRRRE